MHPTNIPDRSANWPTINESDHHDCLVKMTIPKGNYERFIELYNQHLIKDYPLVEFDRKCEVVRFGYSCEGIVWAFRNKPEFAKYLNNENDQSILDRLVKKDVLVISPSKNGTEFEINIEAVERLQSTADAFFDRFKANRQSIRQEFRQWLKENEAYDIGDDPQQMRDEFLSGNPLLKEGLQRYLTLLSHLFEELQRLADTVTETSEVSSHTIQYEWKVKHFSDEMISEANAKVKDILDPCVKDLCKMLGCVPDAVPQEALNEINRETEFTVEIPTYNITYSGSEEAITLYHLRKSGFLTEEHVEKLCSLAKRGLDLFQRLHETEMNSAEKTVLSLKATDSVQTIITKMLEVAPGICVGESHEDMEPKKFLIENMPLMSSCGVKTLFIENLSYEWVQKHFDEYFSQEDNKMSEELKATLENFDLSCDLKNSPFNYTKLVEIAKQAGIRIVCMENEASRHASLVGHFNATSDEVFGRKRISMMNFVSAEMVQKFAIGKFAILAGAGHVIEQLHVPGIAEMLKCPSIGIGRVADMMRDKEICTNPHDVFDVLLP